ncbi:hypothetical protein Poly30_53810 [Planctomycetes bacterium Poly30]|uniref:Uncharacterized protein n=1 Tax=Saltatorellus ferox TaxID=2528018 RepID=A0A518F0G4_9BACT|nr:hypothetical protein Poly30_53810 [Planctomycetes bacterium Poly30]
MEELQPHHLTRLRIALVALIAGLVVDAVDLQYGDIDVLHDAVAALLLAVAGWGLGQAAAASKTAPVALFWIPAVALAGGLIVDALGPGWSAHRGFQMGRFALYVGGLAAAAFGMAKLTAGVGLSSSVKWRRAGLQFSLMVLIPGLLIALFLMAPAQNLPFRHHVGKLDGSWWKTAIGYVAMGLALLATFDTVMAAFTTWRSAGRRT